MEYQYPISHDWTTEEIIDVIKFYELVEKVYEKGQEREEFMNCYRRFKEIVPSKAEEKTLCNEFEEISSYSIYKTVEKAKVANPGEIIRM